MFKKETKNTPHKTSEEGKREDQQAYVTGLFSKKK